MKYMLVTTILVDLLKHRPRAVAAQLDALDADDTVCMSFVTFAALLAGAGRSLRKPETVRRLEQVSRLIPVAYPDTSAICCHYAEQFTRLRAADTPIGANDFWIGCHALAESATLVTHNEHEFRRLVGLAVVNWAADRKAETGEQTGRPRRRVPVGDRGKSVTRNGCMTDGRRIF